MNTRRAFVVVGLIVAAMALAPGRADAQYYRYPGWPYYSTPYHFAANYSTYYPSVQRDNYWYYWDRNRTTGRISVTPRWDARYGWTFR